MNSIKVILINHLLSVVKYVIKYMSEIKKIPIVCYIIGDAKVGKSSVVSRFRILNSSNTIIEGK